MEAVEEAEATTRKVLFGLLFISVTIEAAAAAAAAATVPQLLVIPVILLVVVNDCGKVTCFPGEAGIKNVKVKI